ncbi:RNA-directed DNA polymerase, eukaryota, reverse transcriptase zinc-binding domain protein [Tanacetum coccineum]|uniref:RNA-directed DNA polymerase, eukaryota, reverse transcriptase zinc-binding domain protein n=1 Tax=Tanacetum coccineum TaxID=301880 RepID=A0ABQ5DJB0_9ASTR
MIKRSKCENKGIVPTEMELVLEYTQQGASHEVSDHLKMEMEMEIPSSSNVKLITECSDTTYTCYEVMKDLIKVSKLPQTLISYSSSQITALDRMWSDHIPILLHCSKRDFGPVPFKIFHSWFSREGFDEVINTELSLLVHHDGSSNMLFHEKLKVLKQKIKHLHTSTRSNEASKRLEVLKNLKILNDNIEDGSASNEDHESRINLLHEVDKLDNLEAMDSIQKSRLKWDIGGDENSKFFHSLINQKSIGRQILDGPLFLNEVIDWEWIKACLESSRTSILINGSPTSEFNVRRGLRQGDHLSPFLLIIIMEGLHTPLSDSVRNGLIRGLNIGTSNINLSHLFFADDVIVTTEWSIHDMENIIRIFQIFHLASGLKINIHKSNIYGIGVSEEDVHLMASNTGCSALSSWKSNLLSFGGRFTLIKAVLGSLGIYYLSLFKVPEAILKTLEKSRASFFWGSSQGSKKLAWMKWTNILASYDKGGLDIGSLKSFNLAVLQKWRWRFYSSPDSLWAKVIRALHDSDGGFDHNGCKFTGIWSRIVNSSNYLHSSSILPLDSIRFQVGCGSLTRFWKDIWLGNSPLYTRFNRLFRLDQEKNCRIVDRIVDGQWSWNWSCNTLGVRNTAYLNNLLLEISELDINEAKDKCVWSLAHDGVFSVAALRRRIDDHILPSLDIKTTWDKTLPRKVNIFMWRLKLDRLPHRLNLSSRGIEIPEISCPSCSGNVESNQHIFFGCDFAKEVWKIIRRWCEEAFPLFDSNAHWIDWLDSWSAPREKKHCFLIIMATSLWFIWRYRNNVIFNSQSLRKSDIFDYIRLYSFSWLKHRGSLSNSWIDWLKSPL